MRALGILAGTGSLLHEAREHGCTVLGNIETRSYFKGGMAWRLNFPDAPFHEKTPDQIDPAWKDADVALGHPPCGRHSLLGHTVGGRHHSMLSDKERTRRLRARSKDQGLLPLFCELVRTLQPKTFALDNLPKIMSGIAPPEWWEHELPGYRLTYLTLKNWDYGSPMVRVRLWVVGVRSKKRFRFVPPSERIDGPCTAWDSIASLPWHPLTDLPEIGHLHRPPDWKPWGGYWSNQQGKRVQLKTVAELAAGFMMIPPKYNWPYISNTGRAVRKLGRQRAAPGGPCPIFSGLELLHHPMTGWPLTPRERARLMGWPDDFKIWNGRPTFENREYTKLVVSTGKAVPSELPRYLIPQLMDHASRIR